MAGPRKRCKTKTCPERFTRPQGSRREYCERCRPPRQKPAAVLPLPERPTEPGPIETATRKELEARNRVDTTAGAIALRLARDLDSQLLTASQASSLSSQLLRTMAIATEGAPAAPDEMDELAARRREKARGA
ncbi:hypothetical protein [Micromonospora tarensis]|uniref:Uncharacterized protein n=1 Tax=Micromonospora tarensis TaxID=2806100 RepID=A0ABS1YCG6_9ACTN|nr:hypothetical protein [Micromonospora tarensis]MBM0275105.1 hypothetical protein [Micromonospora tarensis]